MCDYSTPCRQLARQANQQMDADHALCLQDATHPLDETFFPSCVESALAVCIQACNAMAVIVVRCLSAAGAAVASRVVLDRASAPALVPCMQSARLALTQSAHMPRSSSAGWKADCGPQGALAHVVGGGCTMLDVIADAAKQKQRKARRTAALAAGALGQCQERRIRRRLQRCVEGLEQVPALRTASAGISLLVASCRDSRLPYIRSFVSGSDRISAGQFKVARGAQPAG